MDPDTKRTDSEEPPPDLDAKRTHHLERYPELFDSPPDRVRAACARRARTTVKLRARFHHDIGGTFARRLEARDQSADIAAITHVRLAEMLDEVALFEGDRDE